jgi:DNA repair protein RecO (recombination protein O)
MQGTEKVTGIILKADPIGEYDRRVVLLTGEKGKISAFAKGARRQGSRLLAATNPFCFGTFVIYSGRSSYSLSNAEIKNYFAQMRDDYEAAFYGIYFLEVMDYYTHENDDVRQMLNLLYQSLKALEHPAYDNRLVRYIFEIKALALNGEYPGLPKRRVKEGINTDIGQSLLPKRRVHQEINTDIEQSLLPTNENYDEWHETTHFTLDYIVNSEIEKLYNFSVAAQVLEELGEIAAIFHHRFMDRPFKSLEVLSKCILGK